MQVIKPVVPAGHYKSRKWPEMTEEQRREEMAKYTWRNGAKVRKR
jgi:hypothetical protein